MTAYTENVRVLEKKVDVNRYSDDLYEDNENNFK